MKTSKNSTNAYLKVFGYVFIIVYTLWSSKEIARLSNDVESLKATIKDLQDADSILTKDYHSDAIDPYKHDKDIDDEVDVGYRHKRALKQKPRPKPSTTKKTADKKACKKEKRYLKKCRKKLRRKSVSPMEKLQAAHIALDFKINATMFKKLETSKHNCFNEYGGTLCYDSKTFENGERKNILNIPWKLVTTQEWSPLQITSTHGQYKVKYDGLYLVYLNILLIPSQREERFGIFLDNTQIMTCQEGDVLNKELEADDRQHNLTEKSCTSLGVFIVNKDQVLSIRIATKHTKIRLWSVGNNFGVVLLNRK